MLLSETPNGLRPEHMKGKDFQDEMTNVWTKIDKTDQYSFKLKIKQEPIQSRGAEATRSADQTATPSIDQQNTDSNAQKEID